jgi:hypothetical protein
VNLLEKQIMALSAKIDALHNIVEQLNTRVSEAIAAGKLVPAKPESFGNGNGCYSIQFQRSSDPSMEHKDVLMDVTQFDSRSRNGEKQLTPEVQIQRLTAQLTAAYNQIAALEERLLSQRVHS